MGIFDAIGGRPDGAPERAFDVGEKLGAYRRMNSAGAKLQEIMDARQKGITDRQTNAVNEHKARSAKILGILQDGIMQPEGHPKRIIAEQLAQTIQSSPAFMASIGAKAGSSSAVSPQTMAALLGDKGGFQVSGISSSGNVSFKPKENNTLGDYSIDTTTPEGQDAYLQSMSPENAILVKKIASGEADLDSISLRNDQRRSVLAAAAKYDNTFNPSDYKVRFQARKNFTSGKYSQAINSMNTLIGHMGELEKAYKEAGFVGGIPVVTGAINKGNLLVDKLGGGSKKTRINTALTAVTGEMASVFKATGATDVEIKHWEKSIEEAPSPEQQQAILKTAVDLLTSRLEALNQTYKQSFGKDYNFQTLGSKAKKFLAEHGASVPSGDSEISANDPFKGLI